MNLSKSVRVLHRWLAIAFTAGFVLNFVVISASKPAQPPFWVYLFALIPLFALLATGLYMLVRHYAEAWRAERRSFSKA